MSVENSVSSESSPDRAGVLEVVKQIVADNVGVSVDRIQECDDLETTLGCDSLDMVEIMMSVEEHFDISVPDDQAERSRTVRAIADGVSQLLQKPGPNSVTACR